MNNRTKMIVMAGVFAAAASALSSQAAAQSHSSDGYYADPAAQSTDARARPETQREAQENEWLEAQRQRGNSRSVADIPFPVPPTKAEPTDSRPETARQDAQNRFLTQERNETDGNVAPGVPYPYGGATSPPVIGGGGAR